MIALGALSGGHGGGHAHAGGGHALGHGHAGGQSGGHAHSLPQDQSHGGHAQQLATKGGQAKGLRVREASESSSPFSMALSTISPMNIFSLCLGFGATGMILTSLLSFPAIVYAAIAGGLVFNYGMVKPMMNWFAGFASTPSEGIEGQLYQEAEAITRFDKDGRGIVRITLDGQHVQLLATLDLLEVEKGVQVNKGERLIVTEVDSVKNSCRVTRELAM